MSKGTKTVLIVVGVVVALGVLHVWQNVGFENIGLGGKQAAEEKKFRVGFLPVT
ncbi:MAG: hypothetical protein ONB46_25315 [candidate division KSB1 bacterium]|nr:hypothetical protein [candidate division KSB1 bacterium]MDZ7369228.1 hypothetical protein [candidate division KSB1 bacterium]MDZ7407238.1 hypothetical protein [candidate division KSB1 bacterium]